MIVVDVHCHVVPSEFPVSTSCTQWPRMERRGDDATMVMVGKKEFRLVDSRCWDTQRRIADMNREQVGIQVLSPMPELLSYWIDKQDTLILARHVNRAISNMIQAAPDRFEGLGMVPMQDPELAARELGSLQSEYGLAGIEIGSNILGKSPGDPVFDIVYAEAERLGLAIFVHALHPTTNDRLVGPATIDAFVGFPSDVGFAAASFISGRVLEKFPRLRVAFSHGGGTLVSFLPRFESGWSKRPALTQAFASPLQTARRFYYDNVVFDRRLLAHMIETFGESQVFVGSDYPFAGGQDGSADMFSGLTLTDAALAALRGGNAFRFLRGE